MGSEHETVDKEESKRKDRASHARSHESASGDGGRSFFGSLMLFFGADRGCKHK